MDRVIYIGKVEQLFMNQDGISRKFNAQPYQYRRSPEAFGVRTEILDLMNWRASLCNRNVNQLSICYCFRTKEYQALWLDSRQVFGKILNRRYQVERRARRWI